MKKLFGTIVLALIMLTAIESMAKERKEYYTIIAISKEEIKVANDMVNKLNLDTTVYAPSSQGDSVISVLLVFNIDKFLLNDNTLINIVSIEIHIIPGNNKFSTNNDVLVIPYGRSVKKITGGHWLLKEKIYSVIDRYIRELKPKGK